jgi:dTDP-4-amino-4,6-dideoxygalactose transaminase
MAEALAIRGGRPVRTAPFPVWPIFGEAEEQALLRVLRSGKWGRTVGDEVARFEQAFAEHHQAKHGIAMSSGTVGLKLALVAAGIEAGDEVIIPPYTFVATASAVVECSAVPVFADLELDTFNIDPAAIEAAITPRTRAIIPVHLAGLPCAMDRIMAIAAQHRLVVIEDACHAHGAEYRGRRVGAIGHLGVFSFQASKNLNSGEGGIVLTNDDDLAARCRSAHNCGRRVGHAWYEHFTIGGNYRLTEFQGALLAAQWERFPAQAETRERNGKHLADRLARIPGVYPQRREADCTRHGYHLFALRLDPQAWGVPRDRVLQALAAEGIPCLAGYVIPLYKQVLFDQRAFGPYTGYRLSRPSLSYRDCTCPNCEEISYRQGAWLEQRLMLGTTADMDQIVAAFEKLWANRQSLACEKAP